MFETFLRTFSLSTTDAIMICVGAVCFFVFWQTLKKFLLLDYIRFYEAREHAIEASIIGARDVRAKAAALEARYEAEMLATRVAGIKSKLLAVDDAKAKSARALSEAKQIAQENLKTARTQTAQAVAQLKAGASKEADVLAAEISQRIQQSLQSSR